MQSGRDKINSSFGGTKRWFGGDAYARSATANIDWLHPLGNQRQLLTRGGFSKVKYRRNTLQDGMIYDGSLGFEQATSPGSGFGLTISGYRQTSRDSGYATVSGGASFIAWRNLGQMTFVTTTSANRLVGDRRLFLFPQKRKEWLLRAIGAVTFRQATVAGFAPTVRLIAERSWSTVGIYGYKRLAAEAAISRAF